MSKLDELEKVEARVRALEGKLGFSLPASEIKELIEEHMAEKIRNKAQEEE